MSEYKRQILVGGVAAFVVGVIVVAAVIYIPLNTTTSASATTNTLSTSSSTSLPTTFSSLTSPTTTTGSSTTTTSFISTCSGLGIGQQCNFNYSIAFPVTINYTGSWAVSYRGFSSIDNLTGVPAPNSDENYTGGTFGGTGITMTNVTLSSKVGSTLTLCATATKLDSSSLTLIIGIGGVTGYLANANTSAPYGTASTCLGIAP